MSVLHAYHHRAGNVSSRSLLFRFPLVAFSLSSFNTTLTPSIRNHCSCFHSLICRVKVPQSVFLIFASLHHRFDLSIFSEDFSMSYNSNTVYELIRLTYSQIVETFQNVIKWDLGIDYIISSISYRILDHHRKKTEVIVDHVSDLSSTKEPNLLSELSVPPD